MVNLTKEEDVELIKDAIQQLEGRREKGNRDRENALRWLNELLEIKRCMPTKEEAAALLCALDDVDGGHGRVYKCTPNCPLEGKSKAPFCKRTNIHKEVAIKLQSYISGKEGAE